MKTVVKFTKVRFIALFISLALITTGIVGMIVNKGLELGIDFASGINLRMQIAPTAAKIAYNGKGAATINLRNNALTISIKEEGFERNLSFPFSEYPVMRSLEGAISAEDGLIFSSLIGDQTFKTENLLTLNNQRALNSDGVIINASPAAIAGTQEISIETIRSLLSELGSPEIQPIGDPANREFTISIKDDGTDKNFAENMEKKVISLLAAEYGADETLRNQNEYIGPSEALRLFKSTALLFIMAMVLILIYIWIRFKIAYAISAIAALIHDVLIMFGFIAVFRIEFSTVTIAAILTIFGYSLNDTIVVFDRIRENMKLMKDNKIPTIIDTSITQSLSRTIITSLTTMLAVVALFIFATGAIRIFALNMIVGIVIGTYSSIFVASPIYLGIVNLSAKRKANKDRTRFGEAVAVSRDAAPSESADQKIIEIPQIERKLKKKKKKR